MPTSSEPRDAGPSPPGGEIRPDVPPAAWIEVIAAVAVAVLLGQALVRVVALPNVSMVFLLAVLVPAIRRGMVPAVAASLLSVLSYNFFFLEPRFTFTVARPPEFLALVIFLVVAVVTSAIAGQARDEAERRATALRERAELAELARTSREAAETERVRNLLLSSISHDFRTPLASIIGAASSLSAFFDRLTPAVRTDLLGQIRDEAERLDDMVGNLLSLTRIEAGALELRTDWVDVIDVVRRVADAARRRGPDRTVRVEAKPVPLVRADAILLEQAIGNLLANALVHGGAEAHVAIEVAAHDGRIAIAVTDDGPGIPADLLPHVFERFRSGGRRAGDGGEGYGLGLAIARGIAEAHGGGVGATSPVADGHGTRVALTLPIGTSDP